MVKPTDLEQVMHINQVCLPENYSTFFFSNLYERFPATFIVAEENGEVVGYILCRIEKGLSNIALLGVARKAHVISIAVLPTHQHRGIGQALIQEALRNMPLYKARECYLEVRVNNTPAVSLYKKMGFDVKREVRNYYKDGEDAYVMAMKLPSKSTP